MFSSLSTLLSNASTNSNSTSSATAEVLDATQSQNFEEKIPLTSKEEIEKKLDFILTQVQQNQVKHLDLTSVSLGRFYELANTLSGHEQVVSGLAALKNDTLDSGSNDKAIKLWDSTSHFCLSTLRGHRGSIYALAALSDGRLASGSDDSTIKLWDMASYSCLSTLQGHTDSVNALAVLLNGQLASGSWDYTIKLWDLASHSCLTTLWGHTDVIWALAVLPNNLLASGSDDTTIKLWDLASHSCLSTIQGHAYGVFALTVLPNGMLASGSFDKTIKIWESRTLSAKQLPSLLNALKNNTSVMDLDLAGNRDVRDDLMDPLIAVFTPDTSLGLKSNTSLKTIDLRGTGVSKKGVRSLEKAIQHQRLSIEVLADCPVEWKMIYFLIIFYRANRNSPFADFCLELCKYGEIGPFLGIPSGFFARLHKKSSSPKHVTPSLS